MKPFKKSKLPAHDIAKFKAKLKEKAARTGTEALRLGKAQGGPSTFHAANLRDWVIGGLKTSLRDLWEKSVDEFRVIGDVDQPAPDEPTQVAESHNEEAFATCPSSLRRLLRSDLPKADRERVETLILKAQKLVTRRLVRIATMSYHAVQLVRRVPHIAVY